MGPQRRDRSRGESSDRTQRAQWSSAVAYGVLIIGAPQLLGGVFPWGIVAITFAAVVCLVLVLAGDRGRTERAAPTLAVVVFGAVVWTVLQAVPLPCSLVALLAPDSVAELRNALATLKAGADAPTWCTLSRDPGNTRQEILKAAAIAGSFFVAWLLAERGGRRVVLLLVASSTSVLSVVALLHGALAMDAVFGMYEPRFVKRVLLLAPLLNQNNLGGIAAFGVPLWLGIVMRERDPRVRVVGITSIVLGAATALLSLSRGAIAVLLASVAFMSLIAWLRRREIRAAHSERERVLWLFGLSATVATGVWLGVYLGAAPLVEAVSDTRTDKVALVLGGLGVAREHPWIGIGRGAFSSVFVQDQGRGVRFAYPENFVVQWAAEWGVPFAALLLASIAFMLARTLRDTNSIRRIGAVTALFALAGQNLGDTASEVLGVAVVAAGLLGAVAAPSSMPRTRAAGRRFMPSMRQLALGLAAIGGVAFIVLAPSMASNEVAAQVASLRQALAQRDRAAFRDTLGDAVRLHPSEPMFALLAAAESIEHKDRAAPRWLNRAMHLAPGWPEPHMLTVSWLWSLGRRAQALVELRQAASLEARSTLTLLCPVVKAVGADIVQAAPPPGSGARSEFLELSATCLPVEDAAVERIDAAMTADDPKDPRPLHREARRLHTRREHEAAVSAIEAVRRQAPDYMPAVQDHVYLLLRAGKFRFFAFWRLGRKHKVGLATTPVSSTPWARSGDARTPIRGGWLALMQPRGRLRHIAGDRPPHFGRSAKPIESIQIHLIWCVRHNWLSSLETPGRPCGPTCSFARPIRLIQATAASATGSAAVVATSESR
jgi:hypothetical protein